MMKKLLIAATFLVAGKFSFAQITETKIVVDSLERPALYIETDMSENDVRDAIKDYFDSMHISAEKGSGFIIKKQLPYLLYKRAVADSMSGQALDYYFKIDTKKQKGPDITTIYIAASKGYNNFITPQADAAVWGAFKNFGEFVRTNYLQQYSISQSITSINKDLNKDKSKLKDLEDEKAKLEKSIADKALQISNLTAQLQKLKGKQP